MTACGGGSPVDKSLKKIDTAIEKLEKANKKGEKLSKEELDQIGKDLEEPPAGIEYCIEKRRSRRRNKTENHHQSVETVHPRHRRRTTKHRPRRSDEGC